MGVLSDDNPNAPRLVPAVGRHCNHPAETLGGPLLDAPTLEPAAELDAAVPDPETPTLLEDASVPLLPALDPPVDVPETDTGPLLTPTLLLSTAADDDAPEPPEEAGRREEGAANDDAVEDVADGEEDPVELLRAGSEVATEDGCALLLAALAGSQKPSTQASLPRQSCWLLQGSRAGGDDVVGVQPTAPNVSATHSPQPPIPPPRMRTPGAGVCGSRVLVLSSARVWASMKAKV